MGFFEDTITKAREIIDETGKLGTEVIEIQKLKFEASSLKSSIKKSYEILGKYTYLSVSNEEDNGESITKLCEEITEKLNNLETLQQKIALAKGDNICSCGAVNKAGAKYCSSCGKQTRTWF